MISLLPDLRPLVLRVRARHRPGAHAHGPVGLIMEALHSLEWTWASSWTVATSDTSFDLLKVATTEWAHAVRHALRLRQWQSASVRRPNGMSGIEGMDRTASCACWRTSRLPSS
eukprot:RCo045283